MKPVVLNILIITLVYGILYSQMDSKSFGFQSPLDPFYFAFTTMSSVGYGDITPKTDAAKLMVMTQQMVIMTELAKLLKLF
jgi:voltage-gated potassium channel